MAVKYLRLTPQDIDRSGRGCRRAVRRWSRRLRWLDRVENAFRVDRLWQWAWDRHGTRYSWAVFALTFVLILPRWVFTAFFVIWFEVSDRFLAAATIGAATELAVLGGWCATSLDVSGAGERLTA